MTYPTLREIQAGRNGRRRGATARPGIERLEDRRMLTGLVGVDPNTNTLFAFDTATTGTPPRALPITGLMAGDTVDSVAVRPATGQVYVTALKTGVGRLYTLTLTPAGAAATPVGGSILLGGTRLGASFDPVADRLRFVARGIPTFKDFEVDPNTGSVIVQDP